MKKKVLLVLSFFLIGFVTASTVYASTFTNITLKGTYNYDEANKEFILANQERTSRGIAKLEMDYELTKKAQERAREAALYFSHTRANGEDVISSMKVNGENLAAGGRTAEAATEQWMSSSGHKANILDKRMKSVGVASYTTENGVTYWVQLFSFKNSSNNKKFTGSKVVEATVRMKSEYMKKVRIQNFDNKRIELGKTFDVNALQLRNEGWPNVYTTISNCNAKWSSSNTEVATIDNNGKIKAFVEGETTITVNVQGLKASYKVFVVKDVRIIRIADLHMSKTKLDLKVGDTSSLSVTYSPENANTATKIKWDTTNEKVVKVDPSGKIEAVGEGSATVFATSENGKVATCNVRVEAKEKLITKIVIDNQTNYLKVGDTWKIGALVFPKNTTEKIQFKSSNDKIATIDSNGNIKALKKGTVVITVYSKNTSEKFELTIKDNKQPVQPVQPETPKEIAIDRVSLNCQDITLKVGETFQFQYSTYPKNATEEANPTWVGMYYEIGMLDSKGFFTANQAGEGEIKVIVGKKNLTASCKVKIIATDEIESLSIPFKPSYMKVNEASKLPVEVYPKTAATYNSLVWTSSNPDVLSVENNGVIRSHKPGTATITVTAPNGVKTSTTITISD